MKKVLFAIAAMVACVTANAQLWVSGSASISNQSRWNDDKAATSWKISPLIGYALDDALEVGLGLHLYGYGKDDNSEFDFGIAPFARYTLLSEGDFSMFVQGFVEFYSNSEKNPDLKGKNFGLGIEPGIKYTLTDNFAIVATFGGLTYYHYDLTEFGNRRQNEYYCGLFSTLNFGLVYSF